MWERREGATCVWGRLVPSNDVVEILALNSWRRNRSFGFELKTLLSCPYSLGSSTSATLAWLLPASFGAQGLPLSPWRPLCPSSRSWKCCGLDASYPAAWANVWWQSVCIQPSVLAPWEGWFLAVRSGDSPQSLQSSMVVPGSIIHCCWLLLLHGLASHSPIQASLLSCLSEIPRSRAWDRVLFEWLSCGGGKRKRREGCRKGLGTNRTAELPTLLSPCSAPKSRGGHFS